jgi:hypothetical protein
MSVPSCKIGNEQADIGPSTPSLTEAFKAVRAQVAGEIPSHSRRSRAQTVASDAPSLSVSRFE